MLDSIWRPWGYFILGVVGGFSSLFLFYQTQKLSVFDTNKFESTNDFQSLKNVTIAYIQQQHHQHHLLLIQQRRKSKRKRNTNKKQKLQCSITSKQLFTDRFLVPFFHAIVLNFISVPFAMPCHAK